ncbi:MAG: YciI family protein [Alphaproteobacteria bacterium]|nr:YciI family protein [Alphaproteobacteria bacterium]
MKFAIIFHETPEAFARRTGPDAAAYWSAWNGYFGALGPRTTSGACLQGPETGAVVRVTAEGREVQDGPYADSKERLGGFAIIEANSLEDAMEWAGRCPAASAGAVEVRPVLPMQAEG